MYWSDFLKPLSGNMLRDLKDTRIEVALPLQKSTLHEVRAATLMLA